MITEQMSIINLNMIITIKSTLSEHRVNHQHAANQEYQPPECNPAIARQRITIYNSTIDSETPIKRPQ